MNIRAVEALLELALEFVEDIYDDDERERLKQIFKKMLDKGRAKRYKELTAEVRELKTFEYVENRITKKILEELEHEQQGNY